MSNERADGLPLPHRRCHRLCRYIPYIRNTNTKSESSDSMRHMPASVILAKRNEMPHCAVRCVLCVCVLWPMVNGTDTLALNFVSLCLVFGHFFAWMDLARTYRNSFAFAHNSAQHRLRHCHGRSTVSSTFSVDGNCWHSLGKWNGKSKSTPKWYTPPSIHPFPSISIQPLIYILSSQCYLIMSAFRYVSFHFVVCVRGFAPSPSCVCRIVFFFDRILETFSLQCIRSRCVRAVLGVYAVVENVVLGIRLTCTKWLSSSAPSAMNTIRTRIFCYPNTWRIAIV